MNCIVEAQITRSQFFSIVTSGLTMTGRYFPNHDKELNQFDTLIRRALDLAKSNVADHAAISQLGEGWVGDEAIAIAIFSVMKHIDSFDECMVCAVNHDGDSDSTGAIAGNIIGAIHGYSAIPHHFLDALEIEPILVSAADDLCADIEHKDVNKRINLRYIEHFPADVEGKYLI